VGADLSRFPTAKAFANWLGLCPGTKITGGKVMSGKTKRCANRAAQALRLAAAALRTSQSPLGAYFRRLCSRMDKPKATAAAHKLARLIYSVLGNIKPRVAKQIPENKIELRRFVISALRRVQKLPELVKSFFRHPECRYAIE